jgi:adenine-specific DNA-methyltransferase
MATRKTSTTGTKAPLQVETLKHADDKRKNIPTAEFQAVVQREHAQPVQVSYPRVPDAPADASGAPCPLAAERNARNRDLDPQLVWRGKDQQDWSDLVVNAPPLYIQEKVHPKVLIDDLKRQSEKANAAKEPEQQGFTADLFADMAKDFNGVPDGDAKTEFYAHDQHWSNRMILGDSLQVMASLAEREGLRGKVQCIYFDPPYGIKFNSNFQWSTTSRDVKDGNAEHITREPEMVKAFRDTWKDGIHSYLAYIRDRLTVARDLLTDSGSIFVQIGDENVHRVRAVMDEVFGDENCVSIVTFSKSSGTNSPVGKTLLLSSTTDFVLWFAKDVTRVKFRPSYKSKEEGSSFDAVYTRGTPSNPFTLSDLTSQTPSKELDFLFRGKSYNPLPRGWRTTVEGMRRLSQADRLEPVKNSVRYRQYLHDYPIIPRNNFWADTGTGSFTEEKTYVVQTSTKVIERCILMASDPGDLVLDPTCGSGTTAYVAEQWGRRWITIDTSRVALALARARIMGARYPFYMLADSKEGQLKEAEVTRTVPKSHATFGNIRQGFVYERVPHITLKAIANNAEIDVIWGKFQVLLEPLREQLNAALKQSWQEWDVPREAGDKWSDAAKKLHTEWWQQRIARQKEIDASIAAKADFEYLYDRPYEDKKKVRVAGPFTVESLLPHRVLGVGADDELIDPAVQEPGGSYERNFAQIILDNLRTAGVQQAHKTDKINFTSLTPWPGEYVCAEGRYMEGTDADGNGGVV